MLEENSSYGFARCMICLLELYRLDRIYYPDESLHNSLCRIESHPDYRQNQFTTCSFTARFIS
jgi:hypothetical protein